MLLLGIRYSGALVEMACKCPVPCGKAPSRSSNVTLGVSLSLLFIPSRLQNRDHVCEDLMSRRNSINISFLSAGPFPCPPPSRKGLEHQSCRESERPASSALFFPGEERTYSGTEVSPDERSGGPLQVHAHPPVLLCLPITMVGLPAQSSIFLVCLIGAVALLIL